MVILRRLDLDHFLSAKVGNYADRASGCDRYRHYPSGIAAIDDRPMQNDLGE
jgi:hypothetical protein